MNTFIHIYTYIHTLINTHIHMHTDTTNVRVGTKIAKDFTTETGIETFIGE